MRLSFEHVLWRAALLEMEVSLLFAGCPGRLAFQAFLAFLAFGVSSLVAAGH
jgi:hypothetical protein